MLKGLWLRIQRLFLQAAEEPEASMEWRIILKLGKFADLNFPHRPKYERNNPGCKMGAGRC